MSERFCYCGAPLPKGRSKFCSEECRYRMNHNNLSAPKPDDDAVEGYENMPEHFVGAWMTPEELRKRNRELRPLGKRICRTHQGAALPLTEAHFYYANRAKGQFSTECRECQNKRCLDNRMRRCHTDPVYAARFLASTNRWRNANRDRYASVARARRQRRKREQFARVLGAAS